MMLNTITADEVTHKGVDKVAFYKWSVEDKRGELRYLNKRVLLVNADYQRSANHNKVLELSRNWSWIACGTISVAERDGGLWVMDGQHRVLAALKRKDIQELPCVVFKTDDVAEEARGFLNANTNRKAMSAVAKHKAAVIAGDDMAIRIQALFDELGVVAAENSESPNQVRCVAMIRRKAEDNFTAAETVFRLSLDLARQSNVAVQERLFSGLWYLHRNVEGGLDAPRLRKRIKEVGALRLVDAAQRAAAFFSRGGDKVFATGMLETLNKGLQKRFAFVAED